ncbi:cellulose-binding domain-containing protein [Isoptericola sp. BMS4]|uniref:cellulose-binding domain-containing protein n=1 Tax=Isoptericola sp. BMS4 TaxID=2527875 RepID=UPI00141ED7CF|nr:cellulose-binding domain-containing protein [Isoptericola sp. BMS4]
MHRPRTTRLTVAAAAAALALPLAAAVPAAASAPTTGDEAVPPAVASLPLEQNGGTWPTSHVQGIAVDQAGGFVYYSFTTMLVKYDFEGNLVGTVEGFTGHLGDLDFSTEDGRVYGSLEYKTDEAFYVAVIDGDAVDEVGMDAQESDVFSTVYLPEVHDDYVADMDGDGEFDGNVADTADHRYGCSGIDGVSFGPAFGTTGGEQLLTVAYGIYSHTGRTDNDHQVLLQYDVSDWERYERPLTEEDPHRSGPAEVGGKYFVRTGNTTYGVQNLAYDAAQERWFLGVYRGKKPQFPNYLMFAVDAATRPVEGDLVGVPGPGGEGTERGLLLDLADDGLEDPETGIRGWEQKADVGLQPLGHGFFYHSADSGPRGAETADLTLVRWTSDAETPFAPATADELAGTCAVDYTVHGSWPRGFTTQVWVENTGSAAIDGWTAAWRFGSGESLRHAWNVDAEQTGDVVRAASLDRNAVLAPGDRRTFGFVGATTSGTAAPSLVTLNGFPCNTA